MSEATIEQPARRRRPTSAYPPAVADLVPAARRLAMKAGGVPSRRALMRELHIGGVKADLVLTELNAGTDTGPASEPSAPDAPDEAAETATEPADEPTPDTAPAEPAAVPEPDGTADEPAGEPAAETGPPARLPRRMRRHGRVPVWPVLLLTLPAFAAVWSGWVSLGGMAGFGVVHPLPGIWDEATLNTAITLPIGVEVYAAFALWVWLSGGIPDRARKFAKVSAIASLVTGALGQVCYHLLAAQHVTHAPWPIVTAVACLPVAVLGMGAALAHLVRDHGTD